MDCYTPYIRPMLTDFYQITMAYAYWKNNKHNEHSVFDTFFRKCPFKGEYCIFGGISEIIHFLQNFKFSPEEVDFIRNLIPHAEEDFFNYLLNLDASELKVYAVPDGTVVFPKIPVVRIEGPLAVAQLCETTILVLTNFASLITTNAARFRKVAGENCRLLEFGLRRAQGPDGSMTASKYAYLGGFDITSNTLAALINQIPCAGTHAHAFVTSFTAESDLSNTILNGVNLFEEALKVRAENSYQTNLSELRAFVSYAYAFPNSFLALIDTYDSLVSGVPNFLCVALVLHRIGYKPVGIRLDSGDLAYISKQARKRFVLFSEKYEVSFEDLKIVASNDINEAVITSLNDEGHEINWYGIGTNLVTCEAQPALGMVYKLVEINGSPRIKFSDDKDKTTIPGAKKAYRVFGSNGLAICDIMVDDKARDVQEGERILARHPFDETKRMFVVPTRIEKLEELLWDRELVYEVPSLQETKNYLKSELEEIRNDVTRALNPTPYPVSVSSDLFEYIHSMYETELPIKEFR